MRPPVRPQAFLVALAALSTTGVSAQWHKGMKLPKTRRSYFVAQNESECEDVANSTTLSNDNLRTLCTTKFDERICLCVQLRPPQFRFACGTCKFIAWFAWERPQRNKKSNRNRTRTTTTGRSNYGNRQQQGNNKEGGHGSRQGEERAGQCAHTSHARETEKEKFQKEGREAATTGSTDGRYRDETKYRNGTQHRDETKYRDDTQHRDETKYRDDNRNSNQKYNYGTGQRTTTGYTRPPATDTTRARRRKRQGDVDEPLLEEEEPLVGELELDDDLILGVDDDDDELEEKSFEGYPGRRGTSLINIGPGCQTEEELLGELVHAAGMGRMHQRHDRDDYIAVRWDNIDRNAGDLFSLTPEATYPDLDVPYDCGSVTHHREDYMAKDGLLSMTARDEETCPFMGPPDASLSDGDIDWLNRFYGC